MNRTLAIALASGLALTPVCFAQATPAASASPAASIKPEAVPAKIAIIAFDDAVVATNEGQKALVDLQKKYEPKKAQIDTQAKEVDALQKKIQALPASTSDEERASLMKQLDTKQKALQRDGEDAQNAYNSDAQEAIGRLSQKVGGAAVKFAQDNNFNVLLNYPDPRQQGAANQILWFAPQLDITQAVINAYNTSSGVAAPAPSAPTPTAHHTTPAAPAKK